MYSNIFPKSNVYVIPIADLINRKTPPKYLYKWSQICDFYINHGFWTAFCIGKGIIVQTKVAI